MKEYNRFEEGAADGKTSTAVSAPVARIIKIPYIYYGNKETFGGGKETLQFA